MARVVTLLGGESTGKTTLANALVGALAAQGVAATLVPEHLRHWCRQHGRAPHVHEQAALAREQGRLIDQAAADPATELVIADTAPLVIAAYSELYFDDRSLTPGALAWQGRADLTLLGGLDLPWVPDGLFRDSPAVREATDAVLRRHLQAAGLPFQTVYGRDGERTAQALRAICRLLGRALVPPPDASWVGGRRPWGCEKCSDPDCEHRLFSALLARDSPGDTRS